MLIKQPITISVAARSKAWICGRSLAGIAGPDFLLPLFRKKKTLSPSKQTPLYITGPSYHSYMILKHEDVMCSENQFFANNYNCIK
jgi:hypothetical protein